jgi:two-component system, cell cycle response regulator CpdR
MARILLADDEQATRDLVRRGLESDGHTVVVMAGGLDALDALSAQGAEFELLVTDVNMPGMDGIELARRALAIRPDLRVVLMSGLVEHLERGSGLAASKRATIAKPFSLDQMRATVRDVMAA